MTKIVHYIKRHNNKYHYVCNWSCGITKRKTTRNIKEITCKNCLKILVKEFKR